MKLLLGSLLLVALLMEFPPGVVGQWKGVGPGVQSMSASIRPGEPAECFDHELSTHFDDGDQWRHPNECTKITCSISQPDGNNIRTAVIQTVTCGTITGFPAGCQRVTPSLHAVYPNCCPKVKCPPESKGQRSRVGSKGDSL